MIERFSLYNGEVELLVIFNNDKHEYRVKKAGEDDSLATLVPGPTTALNVLDKPLLVPWAAKMAVKDLGYYEKQIWNPDGYIRVPEEQQAVGFERMISILQRIKTMEPKEYWEALHQAKGAHRRGKDEAADAGTLVHQFVEDYINWTMGKAKKPVMPKLPKVKEGAQAWLRWIKSVGDIKFTLSEQKIYSRQHNYAGTLDFACIIDGVPMMGDLKTSNYFYPEMFWQISAYQFARLEEFPEEHYDQQILVRCGKDGSLEVKTSDRYQQSIESFLACWVIWKEKNQLKKVYGKSE